MELLKGKTLLEVIKEVPLIFNSEKRKIYPKLSIKYYGRTSKRIKMLIRA